MVATVGIRELKAHTSAVLRRVSEEGQLIQITYRGKVIAMIVPISSELPQEVGEGWYPLTALAAEIGAQWPKDLTSIEALTEARE